MTQLTIFEFIKKPQYKIKKTFLYWNWWAYDFSILVETERVLPGKSKNVWHIDFKRYKVKRIK